MLYGGIHRIQITSNPVTYNVTVNAQPVGPTLNTKTPNLATVCAGQNVRATFNAGTGAWVAPMISSIVLMVPEDGQLILPELI